MTKFDIAFAHLLVDEGTKYTNDPHDSGGPTKFGITKKTYEGFFGRNVPNSEIEFMTESTAKQIYLALYWNRLSCGEIQSTAMAVCIFNSGVLYGTKTSALLAQQALVHNGASLKIDGIIGDITVGFLNLSNTSSFIHAFHDLVIRRINGIISSHPNDERYRKGWTARADRLLKLITEKFPNQLQGV